MFSGFDAGFISFGYLCRLYCVMLLFSLFYLFYCVTMSSSNNVASAEVSG